ncbi:homocysteine S-methyltransferase [Streptomyces sp. TLI_171]|uniref:homocysteine S-methyltransferase n=1 Tax=Streptomyces sp. TLI_171 TaxID=1938859 RepID=UPI000C19858A|nr:homocysteine S-methyltransferase [Streptomyces sp. TLI_171]RKE18170.1 homocysteine S-methyltransferase [Streptomyces sp. TLI_171]
MATEFEDGSAGSGGPFGAALAAGPLVLDGGLSNQLADQGCDLSDALWSARLLLDEPRQVVAAHRAYFEAGAQVATAASYQASRPGFATRGVAAAKADRLLVLSVELARLAAEEAAAELGDGNSRWVAASVGPYGAVLADGSEYRGHYGLSASELTEFHRPRLEALAAAGPDVLAVETVPDLLEASVLADCVRGLGLPVWFSFGAAGGLTRGGEPLSEAFALVSDVPEVVAVGVNCCAPQEVAAAVALAVEVTGRPGVAYPNSGEGWDAAARDWRGEATFDPGRVSGWVAAGARLVGGCCRVGPGQIAELAALVGADR